MILQRFTSIKYFQFSFALVPYPSKLLKFIFSTKSVSLQTVGIQIPKQMLPQFLLDSYPKEKDSASGQISTSESNNSKNTIKQANSKEGPFQKQQQKLLQLNQLESQHIATNKTEEQGEISDRLFTFMDEKEAERKIIQDFIYKNGFKIEISPKQKKETKENKSSNGIVKIIEDSRKKRQTFLKKLHQNNITLKENRSISKINRMSRSKTPKHIAYVQNKYETLQPRSRSKTPKGDVRVSTPKTENKLTLFRAKSNLGTQRNKPKNQTKAYQEKPDLQQHLKSKESQHEPAIQLELHNQKELLKKKRELEKQLNTINESLLCLKKGQNPKKKIKGGKSNKTQRNKSKSHFRKC